MDKFVSYSETVNYTFNDMNRSRSTRINFLLCLTLKETNSEPIVQVLSQIFVSEAEH